MKSDWRDNPGYQPVPDGTKIDVIYRDGEDNFGVITGLWYATGTNEKRCVQRWDLQGVVMDVVKWRLHSSPEDQMTEKEAWTLAGDLLDRIKESSKQQQTV